MKNPFFLNFILIMSGVCLVSVLLWEAAARVRHWKLILVTVLAVTVVAALGLQQYSLHFPYLAVLAQARSYELAAMLPLVWFLAFWLAFPCLLLVAAAALIRHFLPSHKKKAADGKGLTRRDFLKRLALIIPGAAFLTSGWGNFNGDHELDTTYHVYAYKDLPDYLHGYKIGQLSDLHMGLFFSPRRLQQAIDAVAGQGVNRLEITGDVIDELSLLPQAEKILRDNAPRFPDGIDFCYGNHEYYRGLPQITAMLKKAGVRILRNAAFAASPGYGQGLAGCQGRDNRPFYIAGADFSFASGKDAFKAQREKYVQKALAEVPENAFVLLLAHHPDFFDEAAERGVPLTLSGHTHGAQFAPIGPIVQKIGFKYLRGPYQKGSCRLYVNRGTGHWLPFRVGCSREVSIFELRKG